MTKRLIIDCKKPTVEREAYVDLTPEEEAAHAATTSPVREPSLQAQLNALKAEIETLKAARQ